MDDKYELKFEKVYPNGCVVRVMSPVLTEEERAKRMENLKRAAVVYARHMFEQRGANK